MSSSDNKNIDSNDPVDEAIDLETLAAQAQNLTLDKEELESLSENLKFFFDCEVISLFAYDNSKRELYTRSLESPLAEEIRLEISLKNVAGFVAATGNAVNIKNVRSRNELSKYNRELVYDSSWDEKLKFSTKTMIAVPLPHRNQLVGVMELINKSDGKTFTDEDFTQAKAIAPMMGYALARLDEQEQSYNKNSSNKKRRLKADMTEKLHQMSQLIHSVNSMDQVFLELQSPMEEIFDAGTVTIFSVDNETNELYSKVNHQGIINEIRLPISPSNISGFAAKENRLINITDLSDLEEIKKINPNIELDPSLNITGNGPVNSILAMPVVKESILTGVLQLSNKKNKQSFTAQDENHAFQVAESLSLAMRNLQTAIRTPSKFGYLVENGLITETEIGKVMSRARKSDEDLENLLTEDLHLTPQQVGKSLESFYKIPLVTFDSSLELPDPAKLKLNKETLINQFWVPIKLGDSELIILINDPKNSAIVEAIESHFEQLRVDYRLGLKVDIRSFINALYSKKREINVIDVINEKTDPTAKKDSDKKDTVLIQEQSSNPHTKIEGDKTDMVTQTETQAPQTQSSTPAQTSVIGDESVIKLFDEVIKIAGEHEVTDVHIEPDSKENNIQVRLRKDGACRMFEKIPGKHQKQLIQHIKSISKLDLNQTQLPQNGSLIWEKGLIKLELKVITLPMVGDAEDVTIKIKPLSKSVPQYIPLEKMNFSDPNLERIKSILQKKRGLILVVSANGNGKTTAMHSLLGHINNADKKIVTAEDPVEIVQAGLRQIQINNASGLTLACALGNIILSTPDVIVAGNLPNAETFKIALDAANEQLVFGAMTAESITQPFETMRKMEIDQTLISKSLLMVVNQKLVTTLCEHCKENYHLTKEEFDSLANFYGEKYFPELGVEYKEELQIKKPVGCKKCLYSGYGKKTAIQEVMDCTADMSKLIAAKASMEEIKKQAVKDSMIALNQDAVYKIFKGDCDPKQVEISFLPKEG